MVPGLCVCVTSLHTAEGIYVTRCVYIDWLYTKIRRFSSTDFCKTASFKS